MKRLQAFTLLELAVVLTIIAIVTGMALSSGYSVLVNSRVAATTQRMAAIDQALYNYRVLNDRIPCPANLTIAPGAANYGVEAANVWSCTGGTPAATNSVNTAAATAVAVAEGGVPTATLGLPNDFMYDGWGNRVRYAVDVSMTSPGMFTNTPTGAVCGAITVQGPVTGGGTFTRSTGALYALISHGPNGHGAYTKNGAVFSTGSTNSYELTNCNCTSTGAANGYAATYVQGAATVDPTNVLNGFDDVVTYKERWQMQTAWDKPGTSCPAVYVADNGNSRVQKFDLAGHYLSKFGTSGTGSLQFGANMGAIVPDAAGSIWVVDGGNARVQKIDATGTILSQTDGLGSGSGVGYLSGPTTAALDANGFLWVGDAGNSRIERFTANGNWFQTVGGGSVCAGCTSTSSCVCYSAAVNGGFASLKSLAFDKGGSLWAVDGTGNAVTKFDSRGNFLFRFGSSGTGNGQLSGPLGIAPDAAGNLYVLDAGNSRVEKFDANGTYLAAFGTLGTGTGQFTTPTGLAFDPSGNLYVMDAGNKRVEKFDPTGVYLTSFGSSGSGNGQFTTPTGIAVTR